MTTTTPVPPSDVSGMSYPSDAVQDKQALIILKVLRRDGRATADTVEDYCEEIGFAVQKNEIAARMARLEQSNLCHRQFDGNGDVITEMSKYGRPNTVFFPGPGPGKDTGLVSVILTWKCEHCGLMDVDLRQVVSAEEAEKLIPVSLKKTPRHQRRECVGCEKHTMHKLDKNASRKQAIRK